MRFESAKIAVVDAGKHLARRGRTLVERTLHAGDRVTCNVCEHRAGSWLRYQHSGRCSACRCHTRTRVLWWYLAREVLNHGEKQLLHFAPELPLRKRLVSAGFGSYETADYVASRADLQLDLEHLKLADASYDLVLCSHVLEHVRDDARAIRELRRICRDGGVVLIQVPLQRDGATREDLSDLARENRRRRFGEFDHWRVYGLDIEQRLASSGFSVEVYDVSRTIARAEQDKFGLDPDEILFVCRA